MIYSPDSNYPSASAMRPMNAFPFETMFGMVAEAHRLTDDQLWELVNPAADAIQTKVEIGWLDKAINALLCIEHGPFSLHDAASLTGAVEALEKRRNHLMQLLEPKAFPMPIRMIRQKEIIDAVSATGAGPQFKVGQRIVADLALNNMPGVTWRGTIEKVVRVADGWVYYCQDSDGGHFSSPERAIIAFKGGAQ